MKELTYKYFEKDAYFIETTTPDEFQKSGDTPRVYVVKKWILEKKYNELLKEFRPYHWGGHDLSDKSDSLTTIITLLSDALLNSSNKDLFLKLWHHVLEAQNRECKIYAKYIRAKDNVYPPGEDPEKIIEETKQALEYTKRLTLSGLNFYADLCEKYDMQDDFEFVDAALKSYGEGILPAKIFKKK
jgi:hypothetical protein